jgi:hypothetical protein
MTNIKKEKEKCTKCVYESLELGSWNRVAWGYFFGTK